MTDEKRAALEELVRVYKAQQAFQEENLEILKQLGALNLQVQEVTCDLADLCDGKQSESFIVGGVLVGVLGQSVSVSDVTVVS